MSVSADLPQVAVPGKNPLAKSAAPGPKKVSSGLHLFLIVVSVLWFFPIAYALINSFRTYEYTAKNGYFSWGGFTADNYVNAWQQADFGKHFVNTIWITVPAVILTLFLSCCIAFVVARFSFKFNLALLGLFTAANLLPPQSLLIPVYNMFNSIQVPAWVSDSGTLLNSYYGLIAVNVAFQTGFCAFVLSNYMKTIPRSSTSRRSSTGPACCASSGSSPCRCAAHRLRLWRPSRSPGSTTSSSGPRCSSPRVTSCR